MFILKNIGQYEHITRLQRRGKYIPHCVLLPRVKPPATNEQDIKIQSNPITTDSLIPKESFEKKKIKFTYTEDQINWLNKKLEENTNKEKRKHTPITIPLMTKQLQTQNDSINSDNSYSSFKNSNISRNERTVIKNQSFARSNSTGNLITQPHTLEYIPKKHNFKEKLLPSNSISLYYKNNINSTNNKIITIHEYNNKPNTLYRRNSDNSSKSFNENNINKRVYKSFIQKLNDSNFNEQFRQINKTNELKNKDLIARKMLFNIKNKKDYQDNPLTLNQSIIINEKCKKHTCKRETGQELRIKSFVDSEPKNRVSNQITQKNIISNETNVEKIQNSQEINKNVFDNRNYTQEVKKKLIHSKSQVFGKYLNQTYIVSEKDNQSFVKFYNRKPKRMRIKQNISAVC